MRRPITLISALLISAPAFAAGSTPKIIPVNNGPNTITLGGLPAMAMRAWRDNFNAHSFDVITFYVRSSGDPKATWNLVPVFKKPDDKLDDEKLNITAGGGADCTLDDFRLLRSADGKTETLVLAHRDFGESYADDAPVHFTWFNLTRNKDEDVGQPLLYFKEDRQTQSKKRYCDVNVAFDRELHLGEKSGHGGFSDTHD